MDEETIASRREPPVFSGTLPALWDATLVGKRLVEAFVTLDRLPRVRGPRGVSSHWPSTRVEWADYVAQTGSEDQEPVNRTVSYPTAAEITHMEMALEWLNELRVEDSGMALVTTLWALRKARGKLSKRAKALARLAAVLNARGVPVF